MESKSLSRLFGQQLRNIRKKKKLTQEHLAQRAGLHRTYISSIEQGKRVVSIDVVERLAEALQVPATTLMKNSSAPKNKRSTSISRRALTSPLQSIPKPKYKATIVRDEIEEFSFENSSYNEHEQYYKILVEKLDELSVIEKSPLIREEKAGSIIQVIQLVTALHDLYKASNLFRERIEEYLLIEQESSFYIDIEEVIAETTTALEALKQRAKRSR